MWWKKCPEMTRKTVNIRVVGGEWRRRRRRKFLTRHKMITEVSLISAGCVRPCQTTSGHRGNFANPRLAETTETTGQIGAGIENTQDQPSHHWHWENLHITLSTRLSLCHHFKVQRMSQNTEIVLCEAEIFQQVYEYVQSKFSSEDNDRDILQTFTPATTVYIF